VCCGRQVISHYVEAEKAAAAAAVTAGPLADLQQQLEAAHAQLAEARGTVKQMKLERQEEVTRFEEGLHRCGIAAVSRCECRFVQVCCMSYAGRVVL
jgi:hypothetical protein